MSNTRDFIPITNDVMFKALFTHSNYILENFIASTLNIPQESIKNIRVLNPEMPPNFYEGKLTRLDILLETSDDVINIEMQVSKKEDYKERSLFYWARMYNDQLKEGENYLQAKKCVCINVLDFKLFECDEYHSEFMSLEKTRHELLTDKMDIHFLELPKVNKISKESNKSNSLELWMQLFKADSKEELDMLSATTDAIRTSVNIIYDLSEDEKIREYVRQREKAAFDYGADMANAKAKGKYETLANLVIKGRLTLEEAAEEANVSITEFKEKTGINI